MFSVFKKKSMTFPLLTLSAASVWTEPYKHLIMLKSKLTNIVLQYQIYWLGKQMEYIAGEHITDMLGIDILATREIH